MSFHLIRRKGHLKSCDSTLRIRHGNSSLEHTPGLECEKPRTEERGGCFLENSGGTTGAAGQVLGKYLGAKLCQRHFPAFQELSPVEGRNVMR